MVDWLGNHIRSLIMEELVFETPDAAVSTRRFIIFTSFFDLDISVRNGKKPTCRSDRLS